MDSEKGTTLVELLISLVIAGIAVAALATGVLTYLGAANNINYRLNETPDYQVAAAHFGGDVQSSGCPIGSCSAVIASDTPVTCAPYPATTPLVSFNWTDPGPTPSPSDDQPVNVSYTCDLTPPGAHRQAEIHRVYTIGGSVQTAKLLSRVNPTFPLQLKCYDSSRTQVTCSSSTVVRVDLALQLCTGDANSNCLDSPIPATLTGERRLR
jgi:type II secretory pathway pseudopilin PulG